MSDMPTQLHSTAGLTAAGTGAQQLPPGAMTGAMPAPSQTAAVPAPAGATVAAAKPKPSNNTAMMATAAVLLLALIGGGWWWTHRAGPEAPPATETPAPAPAPAPPTPPDTPPASTATPPDSAATSTATPPVTSTPNAATPGAKPPAAGDAAAGRSTTAAPAAATPGATPGTTGTPPAGRGTDASATSPGAGARGANTAATQARGPGATTAPVDDSFITYKDIKFMAVTGQDSQDQDALINIGGGHIAVVPKNGGAAFATVPYGTVLKATYVHTKDPKWDSTLPAPPDQLQIHGFMRGARHWLTLQSKTAYVLLRLDDSNWRSVLDVIETRCHIKVDRPTEGGNEVPPAHVSTQVH
jgi:hypothetical protein